MSNDAGLAVNIVQFAEHARQRAWERGAPVLWSEARRVDGFCDPFRAYAGLDGVGRRVLWVDPQEDLAFVGVGVAMEAGFEGWTRFADASAWWRDEAMWSVGSRGGPRDLQLPMAASGFRFDPERSSGAEWQGFPDGAVVVPSRLVITRDRESWAVGTLLVHADDELDGVSGRMEDLLAQTAAMADVSNEAPTDVPSLISREETPDMSTWKREVVSAADRIRRHEVDKVVLARREERTFAGPLPLGTLLQRMQQANQQAAVFAIEVGEQTFIGASPETLVALRNGALQTVPLAGSAPRGATSGEDERLARALLRSRKDLHEHEVVVGAMLQALDLVAEVSPDPDTPMVVQHRTVQHLATPIRGTVRENVTALDVVGRLHPTPAVGGYPTEDALDVIRKVEPFDRGWYAGPVGWVDAGGDGKFVIGIRSGLVRGSTAYLYAGCGIVGDSDPDAEYRETQMKIDAIGSSMEAR